MHVGIYIQDAKKLNIEKVNLTMRFYLAQEYIIFLCKSGLMFHLGKKTAIGHKALL